MSIEEENKAVARRVIDEVFNQGNMSILSECIDSDYIYHGATGECRGPDALRDHIAAYRVAFPDIHATIEEIVAEGDTVAFRLTIQGTFLAEFMGMPPTGKRLETMEEAFIHFRDGKEVEAFPIADGITFFQQLGIPFPSQ
jgi:steroid delta-isomerase-like uncharacterized protein